MIAHVVLAMVIVSVVVGVALAGCWYRVKVLARVARGECE